jgi:RimJ/RimL family protein N-acetyltransferase
VTLVFAPMTEAAAWSVLAWRYPPPYDAYNALDPDDGSVDDIVCEMLDIRSPYFAVRDEKAADVAPIAFFAYGSACEVDGEASEPYLLRPDGSLTIGLGLRPDLTGHGHGLALVEAGMAFARERYHPTRFRLYVYAWNARAIRVYERAAFKRVGEKRIAAVEGERVFIEMTRSP